MCFNVNKVFYYVLTQHQYIIINTLVLATCFGFYQPSSGLCLLYGGTFSVHIHYGNHNVCVYFDVVLRRNKILC